VYGEEMFYIEFYEGGAIDDFKVEHINITCYTSRRFLSGWPMTVLSPTVTIQVGILF